MTTLTLGFLAYRLKLSYYSIAIVSYIYKPLHAHALQGLLTCSFLKKIDEIKELGGLRKEAIDDNSLTRPPTPL